MPLEPVTLVVIGGAALGGIGFGRWSKKPDKADVDPERLRDVDASELPSIEDATSGDGHERLSEDAVAWKKARSPDDKNDRLLRLIIPRGTRVYNKRGLAVHPNKYRVEHAYVDRIFGPRVYDGDYFYAHGYRAWSFVYSQGQLVTPTEPYSTKDETCESGIHCYSSKWKAQIHGDV